MQKKKPPKNSIVSILILMTLYHSNDANNKSKEVNIIDPEEQIICKLILNDRRIPSSHSAPSKVLVPAPSDTRGSSPFVSALFDSADRARPLSVPQNSVHFLSKRGLNISMFVFSFSLEKDGSHPAKSVQATCARFCFPFRHLINSYWKSIVNISICLLHYKGLRVPRDFAIVNLHTDREKGQKVKFHL